MNCHNSLCRPVGDAVNGGNSLCRRRTLLVKSDTLNRWNASFAREGLLVLSL